MASTRDLRRRIRSVKSTSQITKAMQMVAASKMRKAQQAALAGRPYAEMLNTVLAEVTGNLGDFRHPLLEQHHTGRRAIILITTDRGLCGALNGNLLRQAAELDRDTTTFICAGRKGAQFVARTKRQLAAEFTYKDTPKFDEARAITKFASDLFTRGEVDEVDVLFTSFISTLNQKPLLRPLLPVGELQAVEAGLAVPETETEMVRGGTEYLFEPSADQVLGTLLPHYVNYRVYQMLLEAKASEHSARMVAMKNATDNAQQLVKDLTLEYNKIRQASITKELLEIATAQMAVG
ncbi:MAG: ATP synthase F1 subunit gamma [Verrucomicrobia bacterium]|nr:ATP synthase F1 subunit gamma [Verrucomicrobiota bacterium]